MNPPDATELADGASSGVFFSGGGGLLLQASSVAQSMSSVGGGLLVGMAKPGIWPMPERVPEGRGQVIDVSVAKSDFALMSVFALEGGGVEGALDGAAVSRASGGEGESRKLKRGAGGGAGLGGTTDGAAEIARISRSSRS